MLAQDIVFNEMVFSVEHCVQSELSTEFKKHGAVVSSGKKSLVFPCVHLEIHIAII